MTFAEVAPLLQTRPFKPFRVITSDGTSYEVRHPDLVMIGVGSMIVGYPHPDTPRAYASFDVVSLLHVVRLEPLELPSGVQGNGNAS